MQVTFVQFVPQNLFERLFRKGANFCKAPWKKWPTLINSRVHPTCNLSYLPALAQKFQKQVDINTLSIAAPVNVLNDPTVDSLKWGLIMSRRKFQFKMAQVLLFLFRKLRKSTLWLACRKPLSHTEILASNLEWGLVRKTHPRNRSGSNYKWAIQRI